jgi:hypothetical protein
MHRAAVTAAAGVLGIVIGAGGWALLGPEKTIHDKIAVAPTASVSGQPAKTTGPTHYATAQAIADKLEAAGFTVSMLHKSTDTGADMGMDASYDFTVTAKPGPAPGDSGINLFRNPSALETWEGLSQGFGGIAVVGDTWAVSLTTKTPAAVTSSKALAPQIAKALGGTVVE